jgi:hypothetical protein
MKWIVAAALMMGAGPRDGWKPLFNGKDLDGWDVYVGGKAGGLNKDPDGVFTVGEIDGAPAMHVTGQTIGAFTTREEYDNFHFRVEFKWGERTWGPRKGLPKDSGILYYCVGPHGAGSSGWMKSVESNVMEEDYGSYWGVAGAIADVELGDERSAFREDPAHPYPVYQKGGKLTVKAGGDGVRPTPIPEPKPGSWNVAEVISVDGTGVHLFNGRVTLVLRNARHLVDGKPVALRKGKIQLQSEFAEVWYRKPEIRAIGEFPAEVRDWVESPGGDDAGFTKLLDEPRLKEWAQCGPGRFDVRDGVATGVGGMGLWWYKARTFRDFVLRGEYLQEAGGNSDSGIFVRFPDPGDQPMAAVRQGHEFEIGDIASASKHGTGAVYPFQGPTWLPVKPPGEWNAYEITCLGRTYDFRLNGHLVNRFVDDQSRPLEGYVGLQNHPYDRGNYDRPVRHRNLRIRELP